MTLLPALEISPTPLPEVNAILGLVLANAQAVLGSHFTGMYLFGSLASGDFNPHSSDIDFVVTIDDDLPEETVTRLGAMHAEIAASGQAWARELEGFYFSPDILRRYQPGQRYPSIGVDWDFGMCEQGIEGDIQRYILREMGIVLAGPPLQDRIDPVTVEQIRGATYQVLVEWWLPMLETPAQLVRSDYQAYGALTMCRMLYTLVTGQIASKPAAARWTMENHARWAGLIRRALAWQHGQEMDSLAEVQAMIRYTYETSRQPLK